MNGITTYYYKLLRSLWFKGLLAITIFAFGTGFTNAGILPHALQTHVSGGTSLLLTDLNWYNSAQHGEINRVLHEVSDISYVPQAGEQTTGPLAVILSNAGKAFFIDLSTESGQIEKLLLDVDASLRPALRSDLATVALKDKLLENPELIEDWKILYRNGRTGSGDLTNALTKNVEALEALNKIRQNAKIGDLGITDDMLGKIQGIDNISYAQMLDEVDKAMDALPAGKSSDFSKIIQNGEKRGLVNDNSTNGIYDRRHSWLTLQVIQDNRSILNQVDEIEFEAVLETIDGIPQSVPDIKLTLNGGSKIKIGEVYAGTAGAKGNLASQSLTYFNQVSDIRDLRFFRRLNLADKATAKASVIQAWKDGGVLDNLKVEDLFKKFDIDVVKSNFDFDANSIDAFLKKNDDWFNLMFNSGF